METPSEIYARLRREMLQAERERVLEVRSTGRVPHEVVEDVLGALDVEESMLDDHTERHERLKGHDEEGKVTGATGSMGPCDHLASADDVAPRVDGVCEDCVAMGERAWVHLRTCLSCGHVGCCDSSPRRHASGHFREVGHPVVRSAEVGETWRWCFVDERLG